MLIFPDISPVRSLMASRASSMGSDRFGNVGVKQSTVFIERYAVAVTVKEFHIQFAFQLANGL